MREIIQIYKIYGIIFMLLENFVMEGFMSEVLIEKDLEIKDILLKRDFIKLNSNTLKTMSVILDKIYETTEELYEDRENIYSNDDAYDLLKSKIFACKTSIKYWSIGPVDNEENIEILKSIIESWDFYNKNNIKDLEPNIKNNSLDIPTAYTCIKVEENTYLLRFIVPCGNKRNDDGVSNEKIKQYKNVVCFININKGYVEIRTEPTYADRIKEVLTYRHNLRGIANVVILRHFNNNIENFKDSFENAKLISSKSIPEFDFDISEEDSEMLVNVLLILEDFIDNKDESILEDLKNVNFDDNSNGFIPLLLAGLCSIGFSTRKTDCRDITNQPMYKIIEPYLNHQIGKLRVTEVETGNTYSIQISMKRNSILFQSELTNESFIEAVRNKLLNIKEE